MTTFRMRTLVLVFALSLLIFIPMRWNASPWLRQQLAQVEQQLPVHIEVSKLQRVGLGITAEELNIQSDQMRPLHLSRLRVQADWLQLLQGKPAIQLHWQAEGGGGSLQIAVQDTYIEVSGLDIRLDSAWLQNRMRVGLPVNLQGQWLLSGDMRLLRQSDTLIPSAANLQLHWQHGAAKMQAETFELGDYTLHVHGQPGSSPWTWKLSGGTVLPLQGKGVLQANPRSWPQWPLSGTVTANPQPDHPLAAFIGGQSVIRIAGTLVHPQWQL